MKPHDLKPSLVRSPYLCTLFTGFLLAMLPACGGNEDPLEPVDEIQPKFDYPLDDVLRFHHLQAKSTHNSYHIEKTGNTVGEWRYSHIPLDRQLLEQGVRHVELDIRYNWSLEYFEAYHLPVLDDESTCKIFTDCLKDLKRFSDAHRAHHPIVVQLEIKDMVPATEADAEAYFDRLHAEIRTVWPPNRTLVPDDLQGGAPTLREALLMNGWPTLGELRGKAIFTMDNGGENRRAYTRDHVGLSGRILFASASPNDPWAAIAVLNDPVGNAAEIAEALAANMLVRTRADSDPGYVIEGGDTSNREAALATGAHFVSTDFPAKVQTTDYWLDIPNGTPSRCNPVTAPAECTSEAIEDPKFLEP